MNRVHRVQPRSLVALALLCGLTGLSTLTPVMIGAAHASGGFGGTSVYGTPRTGSASPRNAVDTEAQASYNRGKSLYESRLACAECPLAGVSLDEGLARDLLFNKRGVMLSPDEASVVDLYLKRRFRL